MLEPGLIVAGGFPGTAGTIVCPAEREAMAQRGLLFCSLLVSLSVRYGLPLNACVFVGLMGKGRRVARRRGEGKMWLNNFIVAAGYCLAVY